MRNSPAKVCFPYAGTELGGSHISSMGLIRHLDLDRYQPVVTLRGLEGPVFEMFRDHDVPVVQAPTTAALPFEEGFGVDHALKAFASIWPITRYLKNNAIDIVHSNDGRTHAVWGAPAKLAGAKLFWHHRGSPEAKGLCYVAPLLADCVASVSQFASPKPGLFSAAPKNHVIHSPFDITLTEDREAARNDILKQLECAPTTKFVGYFGALIDRKRPLLFVKAIAELVKQSPDMPVKGLFFGSSYDGADEEALECAKNLGVSDSIKMMGYRSPGSYWLAGCDLLLVPAVDEPFGRTLIEAMLLGTPVVATNSGGNPEAIRHEETGLLAEAENSVALGEAMKRVLRNTPFAEEMVQNAQKEARTRFGEKRHADAIMALYDDLLQS